MYKFPHIFNIFATYEFPHFSNLLRHTVCMIFHTLFPTNITGVILVIGVSKKAFFTIKTPSLEY